MLKLGIAMIVVSVIFLPIAFVAALFGLGAIASVAYLLAKLAFLLLIPGIVLVVIAARNRGRGGAGRRVVGRP